MNLRIYFKPDEIEILRRIAQTFGTMQGASLDMLVREVKMSRNEAISFYERLYKLRLAEPDTMESSNATQLLVDSLHELDNLRPTDLDPATGRRKLDAYEQEVLRHLARLYDEGEREIEISDFPMPAEGGDERLDKVQRLFVEYGFLERYTRGSFTIDPSVLEAVYQLDNPPPRDYWNDAVVWFRSRWWSVPLVLIVILGPVIAQWIEWLSNLLSWLMAD